MRDLMRTSELQPDDAILALAAAAAAWRAARDSVPLPPELRDVGAVQRGGPRPLPDEMQRLQRGWLESAGSDDLRDYIPSLVRACSGRREEQVHVSSEPMVDVVVGALTARLNVEEAAADAVLYDHVCGTGGMLVAAGQSLQRAGVAVSLYGQDVNQWSAFIAGCAIWLGGWEGRVAAANSLTADAMPDLRYDFAVAEPPFGLSWHSMADAVRAQVVAGRFPGGLPPLSDSSLLFVQHLVTKMRPADEGGGRAVILTAPGALRSAGGDRIRRWLLDEDVLEAVIGLPEGIATRTRIRLNALVLTNRRTVRRRRQVQLVDLRGAFEDEPRSNLSIRRLRPDALESLQQALSTIKSGPISRTVPTERFMYRTVTVSSGRLESGVRVWQCPLSEADDPVSFVSRHIQAPPSKVLEVGDTKSWRIDLDEILNRDASVISAWIRERHWAVTRLAAVADNPSYLRSASAEERDETLAALPLTPLVMLPVEPTRPARFGVPAETAPEGRFLAFALDGEISPEFLVGYLNSRGGTLARRASLDALGSGSSPRTLSKTGIETLLEAMVIPVPDLETQRRLIDADAALQAAVTFASRTAEELWRTPEQHAELVRRVARVGQRQSLVEWAQELPYPLATALWACEAQRANPHAANRQLFLFWEATAEFIGTVLLSALDQDESLREAEMQALRNALVSQHLSMQRATLGVWMVLIQRLGRRFRLMLDSEDADERARVAGLFAGAPEGLVRALCSTELTTMLSQVTERRNEWSGHGGATTDSVLQERNEWLFEAIEALRSLFDSAWADAPLVRAGQLSYEDGVFIHDVERVMGLNTPFLTQKVTVGTPMTNGQLYLVTDGAQRGLEIEPFIQLRSSPENAQFACYFYNRLEGEEARLVSYHLGSEGELRERLPGLSTLVAGFNSTGS
jgi:hypothetical protein